MLRAKSFKEKYNARFKYTTGGWFPCEETVLVQMYNDNHRVSYIAKVLSRDRYAVHAKILNMVKNGKLVRIYKKAAVFNGNKHGAIQHAA